MTSKQAIVLIGAGNIGFRHLQSLLSHDQAKIYQFHIVDPSAEAEQRVQKLFADTTYTFFFYKNIHELNLKIEPSLIISSVRADIQIDVLRFLEGLNSKLYLIEKPFAQSLIDLKYFESINNLGKYFVNLSRRMWPGYLEIKRNFLSQASNLRIEVCGKGWGLGCNALHFIDLFFWILEDYKYKLVSSSFVPSVSVHKRGPQFQEYIGSLEISSHNGSQLVVTCDEAEVSEPKLNVKISFGEKYYEIDEMQMQSVSPKGNFSFYHVSESTGKWFYQGQTNIELAPLKDALVAHRVLLEAFKNAMPDVDVFPIT